MDRRLIEAAQTGNVQLLLNLIKDYPLILHSVALEGGDTPLHTASMAGHLIFVQQIVKLKQQFATELNQDGFSPLHIASANGYVEIVKELLKVPHNLCLLRGKEKRIPLHSAAIKGRIQVLKELLIASPDSVERVTARGETALHLAVKNNQFEGLRVLVEHLKQYKKESVLNVKDEQGNTILHLAVSRKQYEVVDLLLGEHLATKAAVEVNSLNKNGLTPLDILLFFQSEAGDREIEEILRRAGSKKATDLNTSTQSPQPSPNRDINYILSSNNRSVPDQQAQSPAEKLVEYFKYNKARDSPGEVRNALLVIAILIATATYQAVLSPPGGVWQDDSINNTTKPHTAGQSMMATKNMVSFGLFLFFNSVGFFTSLIMIYVLTSGFPLQLELQISIFALTLTYDSSMTALTPNSALSVFFTVISIALPVLIPVLTMVVRNYLRRPRNALHCTTTLPSAGTELRRF